MELILGFDSRIILVVKAFVAYWLDAKFQIPDSTFKLSIPKTTILR